MTRRADRYRVEFTPEARADLLRLLDHLVDRVGIQEDLMDAIEAIDALEAATVSMLARNPLVYRKAADNPFQRELVVPAGATGYVVLFEVVDAQTVWVIALRHQREDDYH